jgi:hypothetical protein
VYAYVCVHVCVPYECVSAWMCGHMHECACMDVCVPYECLSMYAYVCMLCAL